LFSTTTNGIILDATYENLFERNYFSGISTKQCDKKSFGNTDIFACVKDFNISVLPNLNFVIGGWVYSFTPNQLFETKKPKDFYSETSYSIPNITDINNYIFLKLRFVNLQNHMKLKYIIFSLLLFNETTVFDMERNQIGFYYKNKINRKDIQFVAYGFNLVMFLIIFLTTFGVFIIIMVVGFVIYLKVKERLEKDKLDENGVELNEEDFNRN